MRDILLVGINSKYIHSNLAIRYMSTYASVPFLEFSINDDIFSVYKKILNINFEFICFSTYIWNVEYIKKLCGMLYTARPKIKIILGGPEAGYGKEELFGKCSWLYGIVTGEGEEFVKALKYEKSLNKVPNLTYKKDGKIIENILTKTHLSYLNFPYAKEDLSNNLKNKIIYFETSRGCLFNCSYCLSSAEGKTRFFTMDYVKNSLKTFMDYNVPLVKFVDRTFNENIDRAIEIIKFILENNKQTRFHFEIAPQLLTKEFIDLCAKKPSWFQFEMGIQTTNKKTMKAIKRVYDLNKTAEKIKLIPKEIHCHLDLIAGLPHETMNSFEDGFNYVYNLKPDMLQVGFLKVLKHTKMYIDAKNFGIRTTDFPPYEVLSTDTISYTEMISLKNLENAVDRIYNSGAFKDTLDSLSIENPFRFYMELGEKLFKAEYHEPLSRTNLYEFLLEFIPEHKKSLTIDFIKNNRKAKLPECFADEPHSQKEFHKILTSMPDFKDIKFRLIYASNSIFAVSENDVKDVTDILQNTSLQN